MNIFEQEMPVAANASELDLFADAGRKLTKAYVARSIKNNAARFHASVNDYFNRIEVDTYEDDNKALLQNILQYAAKGTGFKADSFADFQNRQLRTDTTFVSRFNAVLAQMINPTTPDIVAESFMGLADIDYVDEGDTARYTVDSNETFYVKEIAEGVQTGAMQRLYKNEFTLNPEPKQIRIELPWRDVVTGRFDIGAWLYKVGVSFSGYISAKVISAMTTALTKIPAAYKASGAFTKTNYTRIAQKVKAANGGKMVQVWGSLVALGKVLPDAANQGLYYGLGERLAKVGYLADYVGLPLIEMEQVLKPGTVNTTADTLVPDDVLYFVPVDSYNPIKIAFEGDSVTVEKEATKSSDKYLGIAITMRFGVAAVIGSIFGAYTNLQ